VCDPGAIIAALNRHEVRFVVIGGMAAMVRDLPAPATVDIDNTPQSRSTQALGSSCSCLGLREQTYQNHSCYQLWFEFTNCHLTNESWSAVVK